MRITLHQLQSESHIAYGE